MKRFIYEVAGYEFEGAEAFGKAWKDAKATAAGQGLPIYRTVIKGEAERHEVFTAGGCFLPVDMVKPEDVALF